MTQTATPPTVSYEVYQAEREQRIKAERERDYWKNEFYLQRQIRRAPVLQPVTKAILEEFRHVEKWGKVKGPDGSTRGNYTTIAKNLKVAPDTVARHAERLEKLDIIDVIEFQGPQDERERKYVHVKEEKLKALDQLTDPDRVIPKQGGDRYSCTKCGTEMLVRKVTTTRTVTTLLCPCCNHESLLDDTTDVKDTGWKTHDGHKPQKQLAFENSPTDEPGESTSDESEPGEKQNAEQCVDTPPSLVASPENLMAELKALRIWAVGRNKEPFIAEMSRAEVGAKSNDPTTWRTFDQAHEILERSHREGWKRPYDCLMFANNGDYVFTDIDHCRDTETGELGELAQAIISRLDSYAEESYSGTGVHIVTRGHIPRGRKHNGVEMYPDRRFFTFTGRRIPGTLTWIAERQDDLTALYKGLFPADAPLSTQPPTPAQPCSVSEEEIVTNAMAARNGAKFAKLWRGDASDYLKSDGTPDCSRADLALCEKLAYWGAGGDVSTIDRLFRQSGLYREKWERADYREKTITKAIAKYLERQPREDVAS